MFSQFLQHKTRWLLVMIAACLTLSVRAEVGLYTRAGLSDPYIASGPDGAVWYGKAGVVARSDMRGVVREFPLTTTPGLPRPQPRGLKAGPDGNLWVADYAGRIHRVSSDGRSAAFVLPSVKHLGCGDSCMTVTPDLHGPWAFALAGSDLYLATHTSSLLFRVDPGSGNSSLVADFDALPGAGLGRLQALAGDPGGAVWLLTSTSVIRLSQAKLRAGGLIVTPDDVIYRSHDAELLDITVLNGEAYVATNRGVLIVGAGGRGRLLATPTSARWTGITATREGNVFLVSDTTPRVAVYEAASGAISEYPSVGKLGGRAAEARPGHVVQGSDCRVWGIDERYLSSFAVDGACREPAVVTGPPATTTALASSATVAEPITATSQSGNAPAADCSADLLGGLGNTVAAGSRADLLSRLKALCVLLDAGDFSDETKAARARALADSLVDRYSQVPIVAHERARLELSLIPGSDAASKQALSVALDYVNMGFRQDAGNVDLHILNAWLRLWSGEYDAAERSLSLAERKGTQNPWLVLARAQLYMNRAWYADAASLLESHATGTARFPTSARAAASLLEDARKNRKAQLAWLVKPDAGVASGAVKRVDNTAAANASLAKGTYVVQISSYDVACPYCVSDNPIYDRVAERYRNRFEFRRVLANPWVNMDLVLLQAAKLSGVPAILVLKDGVVTKAFSGAGGSAKLETWLATQ